MTDKIQDAILSRFRAGDPIVDIADDIGIPASEVEQSIRSTGCVNVPDWLIYRGIQMAVDGSSYPMLDDWLHANFHGLDYRLKSDVLLLLSIEATGEEMNPRYADIADLLDDLTEGEGIKHWDAHFDSEEGS